MADGTGEVDFVGLLVMADAGKNGVAIGLLATAAGAGKDNVAFVVVAIQMGNVR